MSWALNSKLLFATITSLSQEQMDWSCARVVSVENIPKMHIQYMDTIFPSPFSKNRGYYKNTSREILNNEIIIRF
jgi:hypothetical protein